MQRNGKLTRQTSIYLVGAICLTEAEMYTMESQEQILGQNTHIWYLYSKDVKEAMDIDKENGNT
jgi:hypothetical protein